MFTDGYIINNFLNFFEIFLNEFRKYLISIGEYEGSEDDIQASAVHIDNKNDIKLFLRF